MVGADKVVVDGLRHADDTHLVLVTLGVLGKLCNGIHRIVAANIEEIAYVVLLEDLKQAGINLFSALFALLGKLLSARAESRCGSVLKTGDVLFVCKNSTKIDKILAKKSLNAVAHTVESADSTAVGILVKKTSDNTGKCCIDCRGRSAGLTYDSISVKNSHNFFSYI